MSAVGVPMRHANEIKAVNATGCICNKRRREGDESVRDSNKSLARTISRSGNLGIRLAKTDMTC